MLQNFVMERPHKGLNQSSVPLHPPARPQLMNPQWNNSGYPTTYPGPGQMPPMGYNTRSTPGMMPQSSQTLRPQQQWSASYANNFPQQPPPHPGAGYTRPPGAQFNSQPQLRPQSQWADGYPGTYPSPGHHPPYNPRPHNSQMSNEPVQPHLRSQPSIQKQRGNGFPNGYPSQGQLPGTLSRPNSQIGLQPMQHPTRMSSQAIQEERHYQNISMYQMKTNGNINGNGFPPNMRPPLNNGPPKMHHSSYSSLHPTNDPPFHPTQHQTSTLGRPLSAYIPPRKPQEQFNANPYAPQTINRIPQQMRPNAEEWAKRSQNNYNPATILNSQIEEQEERLRRLRFEEIKRHQELQVAQQAEEQILKAAKNRQEEESVKTVRTYPPKLDLLANTSEADVPPPLPKSPPPLDSGNIQRLDRLINDTSKPESKYPSALRNGDAMAVAPVTKKVSWNDRPESPDTPNGTAGPTNDSFTLQDIDEVLGTPAEPEESSNFSMVNTPNVIGAQEVYRDPRERIKLEKMKNAPSKIGGPEKLSFKDKIKMFAMESALQDAASDKNKNSKAQREIEDETEDTEEVIES